MATTPPPDPNDPNYPNQIPPMPAIKSAPPANAYPTPGTTPRLSSVPGSINTPQFNFDFSSLRVAFPNTRRRVPIPIPYCDFPSPCNEDHPFFHIEELNNYRKGDEFWDSWRIAWWKWHGHGDKEDHESLSDDEEDTLNKKKDPSFVSGYTKGESKETSLQRMRLNVEIQRELDARIEARRVRNLGRRQKYQFGLKHREFMRDKMANVLWFPKKAGEEGIIEWDVEDPQVDNPLWNKSDALNLDPLLEPAYMLQFSVIDQGSLRPRHVWNGVRGAVHTFPIREERALRGETIGGEKANVTRKSFPVDIRRVRNRLLSKTQDVYATEDNYRKLDNRGLFLDPDVVDRYNVTPFTDLSQDWLEEWRRDNNYTGSQMPNEQEITLAENRGERPREYCFDPVYRAGGLKNAWHTSFEATSILQRELIGEEEFKANFVHEHEYWMEWLDETKEDTEAYFLINLDPRTVVVNNLSVKQNQIAGPLPQFAVIEIEGQIGFWFGKNGLDYAPPPGGREDPIPFEGEDDVRMPGANRLLEDNKSDENVTKDSLTGLKKIKAPDMPRKRVFKKYTDEYVDKSVDSDTSKRARLETDKGSNVSASEDKSADESSRIAQEKEREHLRVLRDQCRVRGLHAVGNSKDLQGLIDKYDRGELQANAAARSQEKMSPSPNPSDKELEMLALREQCKERDINPFGSADDMRAALRNYEGAKIILPGLTLEESIEKHKETIASIDFELSNLDRVIKDARVALSSSLSSKDKLSMALEILKSSKKNVDKLKDERKTLQKSLDLIASFPITNKTDAEVKLSRKQTILSQIREIIVHRNFDLATKDKDEILSNELWYKGLIFDLDEDVRSSVDIELKLWQGNGIKHTRDGNVDEEFSDKKALEELFKAERENMSALAEPQEPKLNDFESSALLRYREQRRAEQGLSEKLKDARSRDPTFSVKEERSELVKELRLTREKHESINLLYATPRPLRDLQQELLYLDIQFDASNYSPNELKIISVMRSAFLYRHPKFQAEPEVPSQSPPSAPEDVSDVSDVSQKLPTLLTRDLIQIWRNQMDEFYLVLKDLRRANQLVRTADVKNRSKHLEAVEICEEKIEVIKRIVTEHHSATAYAATNQLVDQMEREEHMRKRIAIYEESEETGNPLVDEAGRPLLDYNGRPLDGNLELAIQELQDVVDEHNLLNYIEALKAGAEAPKSVDKPTGPPSPLPPNELTGNSVIDFYNGGKDPIGQRTLHDILSYSRKQLETTHDYIQIAFPITEASNYVKKAPLLDKQAFEAFRTDGNLVRRLRRMFCHMLEFYGFRMAKPRKTSNGWRREIFEDNFLGVGFKWLKPSDHNHNRITRIIRCLRLVGMEDDAQEFLKALERRCSKLPAKKRPSDTSLTFWRNAASWPLDLIPSNKTLSEASGCSQGFLVDFEKQKREYAETEETRREENLIVRLFTGGTDEKGRSLHDMALLSDNEIAVADACYPLMFPLPEKSHLDDQAHQIDQTSFEAFHINYRGMQDQLKMMLVRILSLLGMDIQWTIADYYHTVVEISKSDNYSKQSLLWLGSDKVKWQLRIRNIIRSLRIASLEAEAQELYNFVRQAAVVMPPGKRPRNEIFHQWAHAVSRPLNIPPSIYDEAITDETGPDFLREYERKKADEAALLAKFPPYMPQSAVIGPDLQPRTGIPPPLETSPEGTPVGAKKGEPRGQGGGTAQGGKEKGVAQVGTKNLDDPFRTDSSSSKKVRFNVPIVVPASGPPTGTLGSRPTKSAKRPTTTQVFDDDTPTAPQKGSSQKRRLFNAKTTSTTTIKDSAKTAKTTTTQDGTKTTKITTTKNGAKTTKITTTKNAAKTTKTTNAGAKDKSTDAQATEEAKKAELAAKRAELDNADQLTEEIHIANETNRMNDELRDFNWLGPLVPPDPSYKKNTERGSRGYICADYVKSGHPHIMDMRDPLNSKSWPQLYGDGNWNGKLGKLLSLGDLGLSADQEKELRKWQQGE